MRQLQAAQTGGLFVCHIVGHQQHLKSLAHAAGRNQVLELQRNLGMLLRQLAILERIGELRFLPNADEKLRLREQRQRFESALAATGPQAQ